MRRAWAGHGARADSDRASVGRLRRPAIAVRQRAVAAQVDRIAEGQSRILEMIASGAELSETLAALVRLIESVNPEVLGSILLLDDDGRRLRHGAAPSLPAAFCRALGCDPTEVGHMPAGDFLAVEGLSVEQLNDQVRLF
jgi:hypothetical protein